MHQLWDKLLKIVGDYFPEELVRFIFPKKKIKLCGKYEQEKIVLEYQVADINFWIEDDGVQKLLNIEPYSGWDNSIAYKVFTRNGILTKSLDYKYPVVSVVVLLEKEPHIGKYEVVLGGKVINHFHFPVVSLRNLKEILTKYPSLAPFVLKIDLSLKEKVIEVVRKHRILRYITVLVLNRQGIKQEEALAMVGLKLEEFKQALLEVPIMQDIFLEKRTVARNMLRKGLDIALIAEITGLKQEEIVELKQE